MTAMDRSAVFMVPISARAGGHSDGGVAVHRVRGGHCFVAVLQGVEQFPKDVGDVASVDLIEDEHRLGARAEREEFLTDRAHQAEDLVPGGERDPAVDGLGHECSHEVGVVHPGGIGQCPTRWSVLVGRPRPRCPPGAGRWRADPTGCPAVSCPRRARRSPSSCSAGPGRSCRQHRVVLGDRPVAAVAAAGPAR